MRLLGKQLCCGPLLQLTLYLVCCLSFLSPVWTETKRLQGKFLRSELVRLSSSSSRHEGVTYRHSVVGRGESERKAQTANQLIPMSPVAKKRSVDWPVRTESTESVTDWAKRTGMIGFLPVLETEAWWENTEFSTYSKTTSVTNSCLWVVWHFFQEEHRELLMFTPVIDYILNKCHLRKLLFYLFIFFTKNLIHSWAWSNNQTVTLSHH